MIYRSVRYLDFMVDQLERYSEGLPWRIVANDPTPEVVARLMVLGVPYSIYRDPEPNLYYLRRVYRCVNWYYKNSDAEALIEVQSDMAYSPGWADALITAWGENDIPVSRLVHPFTIPGGFNLERDFGSAGSFREAEWLKYAASVKSNNEMIGGLYCPRLMERDWFLSTGGFPEGNVLDGGAISEGPNELARSGDAVFFEQSGKRHVTVCSSLVYHMQEGEMLDK